MANVEVLRLDIEPFEREKHVLMDLLMATAPRVRSLALLLAGDAHEDGEQSALEAANLPLTQVFKVATCLTHFEFNLTITSASNRNKLRCALEHLPPTVKSITASDNAGASHDFAVMLGAREADGTFKHMRGLKRLRIRGPWEEDEVELDTEDEDSACSQLEDVCNSRGIVLEWNLK
ncbi:hypothetical protein ACM66B_005232 [Microbotryomycetes sp. NB124-2]